MNYCWNYSVIVWIIVGTSVIVEIIVWTIVLLSELLLELVLLSELLFKILLLLVSNVILGIREWHIAPNSAPKKSGDFYLHKSTELRIPKNVGPFIIWNINPILFCIPAWSLPVGKEYCKILYHQYYQD